MLFVSELNTETQSSLWKIARTDTSGKRAERAHAVLLSAKGYGLESLAEIFARDRDTVSSWLKAWENHAFDGLCDAARSGRPPLTTAREDAQIIKAVREHPQQIRQAQAVLQKKST